MILQQCKIYITEHLEVILTICTCSHQEGFSYILDIMYMMGYFLSTDNSVFWHFLLSMELLCSNLWWKCVIYVQEDKHTKTQNTPVETHACAPNIMSYMCEHAEEHTVTTRPSASLHRTM